MEVRDLYQEFLRSDGVCIDTRVLKPNQIFFALQGTKANGNEYAIEALKNGARLAIVEEKPLTNLEQKCIYCASSLAMLQSLATYHRDQFNIPVVGITGSVGKTTTKELVTKVLERMYKVISTQGNLNNQLGVPLTLLTLKHDTEIAVIEMGANHLGEIAQLCDLAKPTHGLITRIGKAHLEGFGSIEGVIKAKSELFQYLVDHHGTAFINDHDEVLLSISNDFKMKKIFIHTLVQGELLESDPYLKLFLKVKNNSMRISTSLPGVYNKDNVLMAVAVADYFNIPPHEIKLALESYVQSSNRSQHIVDHTNDIILDAYNANPLSMAEAIKSFQAWNTPKKKTLILGEMKELGDASIPEHQKIIDLVNQYPWYQICLVGPAFSQLGKDQDHLYFSDVSKLKTWFDSQVFTETAFLIKGSRSIALERVIDHLTSGSTH